MVSAPERLADLELEQQPDVLFPGNPRLGKGLILTFALPGVAQDQASDHIADVHEQPRWRTHWPLCDPRAARVLIDPRHHEVEGDD